MNCIFEDKVNKFMLYANLTIKVPAPEFIDVDHDFHHIPENIMKCISRGNKIIIIPFGLTIDIKGKKYGHANLLIYRRNTNQIEHIEPHGAQYGGPEKVSVVKSIRQYLTTMVYRLNFLIDEENEEERRENHFHFHHPDNDIPRVTLVKSNEVCPVKGVQALESISLIPKNSIIEPEGYCSAWSMFFAELCLKNPEIPSKQIYAAILKKSELYSNQNDYLRNIIRGYTCFINNKLAKYFSQIYDEPITSTKLLHLYKLKEKKQVSVAEASDTRFFFDKLLTIMETELHINFKKLNEHPDVKQRYPDVKQRYTDFTRGIRSKTSSSSLKDEDRIASPRRASASSSTKKSPRKVSSAATTKKAPRKKSAATIEWENNKTEMKEYIQMRKQKEEEEKQRIKAEKQEIKAAKQLIKADEANTKQFEKEQKEKQRIKDEAEKQRIKAEKEEIKASKQFLKTDTANTKQFEKEQKEKQRIKDEAEKQRIKDEKAAQSATKIQKKKKTIILEEIAEDEDF